MDDINEMDAEDLDEKNVDEVDFSLSF